ncbi:lipase family protein [Streptomyces sp. E11-3]|uniref:lipase family protein n=1 Tax=Streptomyces sp. E11-3 TaxID=3110112 RepID=UPI00397F4C02
MRDDSAVAPDFDTLRPDKMPLRPARDGFPVYPDLVERLAEAREQPDRDGVIPHALATCAAYAYSGYGQQGDAATVATIMARLGLAENRCRVFEQRVDAMFITSAAYLVQDRDRRVVILGYRGTQPEDIISLLTDADVRPETLAVDLSGQRYDVHAGFYRNMRATRYAIIGALERALRGESILDDDADPEPRGGLEALYVTGHSLGGAMAALMGVVLAQEPRYQRIAARLRGVYTFGQPMLGGADFALACEGAADSQGVRVLRDRVIRYIYDRDVVPALPPLPIGPFAPFGREFHFRRRRGTVERALSLFGDTVLEALTLPSVLVHTPARLPAHLREAARRTGESAGRLLRPDEEAWREVTRPALYPQMASLAGLTVMAPLAFIAVKLALTRSLPFRYSFEDHGPSHYVTSLAPPGVLSEYGDLR